MAYYVGFDASYVATPYVIHSKKRTENLTLKACNIFSTLPLIGQLIFGPSLEIDGSISWICLNIQWFCPDDGFSP